MSELVNALIPIAKIKPHPENYNRHPDAQLLQLEASYEEFGQYNSIVVWQRPGGDYLQVARHGFLEAMKRKGATEIRADILPEDTDPMTIKRILLADNLHPQNSATDDTLLAELLQEQVDAGYALASLGTDEEMLRQMLESLGDEIIAGDTQEQEDDFDTTPDETQTRCKPGDIWRLGNHKIGCLDSTDAEQVKRLFTDAIPHMVWSDPPYGIAIVATNGYVGGGEAYDIPFGGVKNRGDVGGGASHIRKTGMTYMESNKQKGLRGTVGASKPFGSKASRGSIGGANPPGSKNNLRIAPEIKAGKYYPVIGDDSPATAIVAYQLCAEFWSNALQIWWGANYYANALPPSKCWIVWDKENTGNFADAELAWCSDDSAVRIFKHMWNGLMKDSEKGQRRVHPTQKPVALAEWAFEKYGKERDVIYDPFLGSGISVIAAQRLNRTVYGCELSPEYIDVVIRRWEAETGQTATLLDRVEVEAHA